jgi:uncharacterized Zn finger protein
MSEEATEARTPAGVTVDQRLGAAALFCDNCGATTPHRILRVDRSSAGRPQNLRGTARCKVCRLTHPFESAERPEVERTLIVSSGARSERQSVRLPRFARLAVDERVPGSDPPVTIRKIDLPTGASPRSAIASEVATIWGVLDTGAVVRVSLVEGPRTHPVVVHLPHGTELEVGDVLEVEGTRTEIVALRADGHTWHRPGDRFSSDRVDRAYVRRTEMPPAGRSDWSRSRVSPSSAARATSRPGRSRSSPGIRVTRRVPRARSADGGADDQS